VRTIQNRKTAPRVVGGRVLRKNNWQPTPGHVYVRRPAPMIVRERPGHGYEHMLLARDVERFLALLPHWDELAIGLNTILLDAGHPTIEGWHRRGVVALTAWERTLWVDYSAESHRKHAAIYDRIDLTRTILEDGYVRAEWTPAKIRAFQLTHILTHELGHHHDAMTNRSRHSARGEEYAESYANALGDAVWARYVEENGFPD
jgi:hypothetical protein